MSAKYIQIERIRRTASIANNMQQVVADINVGDESDLPALNEQIGGMIFMPTTIAVTKTGVWYKLYADGTWYKQDGSGDTSETPSNVSAQSASPSLSMASPAVIDRQSFSTLSAQNEPEAEDEITEPEGGEEDAELL